MSITYATGSNFYLIINIAQKLFESAIISKATSSLIEYSYKLELYRNINPKKL